MAFREKFSYCRQRSYDRPTVTVRGRGGDYVKADNGCYSVGVCAVPRAFSLHGHRLRDVQEHIPIGFPLDSVLDRVCRYRLSFFSGRLP